MRKALIVVVLVLGISLTVFAGALDKFTANYGAGNLHTLLCTDPVDLIKLLGEEPTSYGCSDKSNGHYTFTYVKTNASDKIKKYTKSGLRCRSIFFTVAPELCF